MATEAKRKAIRKYDAANTRQIHLKLNLKTDADILEHLGKQESIQGYIKGLIRADNRSCSKISKELREIAESSEICDACPYDAGGVVDCLGFREYGKCVLDKAADMLDGTSP